MGKNNKYFQGWLERRGASSSAPAAQKAPDAPPPPAKDPVAAKEPEANKPPPDPGVRVGYRSEPDGVWHPAPTAKKYLDHMKDCTTCAAEAEKLGIKATGS